MGRDACTGKIGLDKAGVEVNAKYVYHLNSLFSRLFSQSLPHPITKSLLSWYLLRGRGERRVLVCHGDSQFIDWGHMRCVIQHTGSGRIQIHVSSVR